MTDSIRAMGLHRNSILPRLNDWVSNSRKTGSSERNSSETLKLRSRKRLFTERISAPRRHWRLGATPRMSRNPQCFHLEVVGNRRNRAGKTGHTVD